jgi:gluconolactonase
VNDSRIRTHFEVIDERFRSCQGDEWVERLYTGCRWAEGPAYFPASRSLVFSDIPNDRVLRFDELTGTVGVLSSPAGYSNGHTVDRQGRLLSCEQGHRRVTRTEHDGTVTVISDNYEAKRLNSPNDLVEHSDGSIWFTDPSDGIDSDYEGHMGESESAGRQPRVGSSRAPMGRTARTRPPMRRRQGRVDR